MHRTVRTVPVFGSGGSSKKWRVSLGWRVCRAKFAQYFSVDLRIFLRKMLRNVLPKYLGLLLGGSEKSRKIPAELPQKIHRGASAGAKGEGFCVSVQFNRKGRFRFRSWFLKNGSGGSGLAFGSWQNRSEGSGFRFQFGSWVTLNCLVH